jgi:cysteine sulfinate desulfinase/cysteine desulfurase-like protein
MGLPLERVQASVRFSLGRSTTAEEIDRAAEAVTAAIARQRATAGARR